MTTTALSPAATGRHLATVETILELAPIEGADAIVRARIRGWDVVVKLGEFQVGDLCVYLEVDSMIDMADDRFAFLAPRGVRTDTDGVSGHVLKTARLRGQYSQGLALPIGSFPELAGFGPGDDVTDLLPLIKWDPPLPANLAGAVRGYLPSWIRATDEERLQNVASILEVGDYTWQATEKLDGMSTTFYVDSTADVDAVEGVCTRNMDLLPSDNLLWTSARALGIHALIADTFPGRRAVVQGETFGEGIQGNPLQRKGQAFAAFNLLVDGSSVPREQWPAWLVAISVPIRDDLTFPTTVDQGLADVDRLKSALAPARAAEGVVWRSTTDELVLLADGRMVRASFKTVSNHYLLKADR